MLFKNKKLYENLFKIGHMINDFVQWNRFITSIRTGRNLI